MFGLSAPSWKLKRPKPRKKRPDKLIMALDLWLSIRLLGIRHPIKYHGDKHQGISIKPLGLILLSISGLSSGLYQPITVAPTKANPSKWEGLKRCNTPVSLLSGCRIWWSRWCCLASIHPLEGRLRRTVTPWGGTDTPSRFGCLYIRFGSESYGIRLDYLFYLIYLYMQSRNQVCLPLCLLREFCRYRLGKTQKAGRATGFLCWHHWPYNRCDLTFPYDVISIFHVLFVLNK